MNVDDKEYTIADIEALPEGERAELIDGKMYMMASPTKIHQKLLNYINMKFYNWIESNGGDCEEFIAPFAVYLDESKNYVEPDVLIVCDSDKLDDKGCHGAPDLVVEIVSPSSERMDYYIKLFKYRAAGVREYWIVDSAKQRVQVYDFENNDMAEYTFSDDVPVTIYKGKLTINISKLFE
ncbi:MAG: Uma2 family endonuclease [Hespellia sp.]|nr:Uma2 family endonuclease [Hespellia sp.]